LYFKKVNLLGFKTFADKTDIELTDGITCIVGPNGSGKSNIADAVRWVLGEQSLKSMRSSKLEEVIFAGSDIRRPLGLAQVSITFDNTSGSLPIEYSEVNITRKVYRSGDSEYYINKVPCRLKDIQHLLMNTGIGRDSYSIIGQGEVDLIFSAKPEEKRILFDEASGISKYKYLKKEAERRLQDVANSKLRLSDIIAEIENQLVPLRIAKEKAIQYQEVEKEMKELDINYRGNLIKKLEEKQKSLKNSEQELLEILKKTKDFLENKENELSKILQEELSVEKEIDTIQTELPERTQEIERTKSLISLSNNRLDTNIKNRENLSSKLPDFSLKNVHYTSDIQKL
jgi:chromosome segregation protein